MGLFDFFKKVDPAIVITENDMEVWFRDTYAIWSQTNYDEFRYIGGSQYYRGIAGDIRYILRRDWNIHNREETLEQLSVLKETQNKSKGNLSWDLCRGTQILAMAYIGGYFTRQELNDLSKEVAIIMQQNYSNWNELLENYIDGFRDWAMFVYDETEAEKVIAKRYEVFYAIKHQSNPPYQIDWNFEFK